jgi:hypothetical protein
MPGLDDEMVGRPPEVGQRDLGDVDPESRAGRTVVGHARHRLRRRPPGDLRLADPRARVVRRWVDARAVQREARVAQQVTPLQRARHRAEPDVVAVELHLDSADPGRAVGAQRGHRLVLARLEELPDAFREIRSLVRDLSPRRHGVSVP